MPVTERMMDTRADETDVLFQPTRIGSLEIKNRIVMAPMTRAMSPGGIPGPNVARYYGRRAENDVGLIITEGSFISPETAAHDRNAPRFYGDDALKGWMPVVDQVHQAGARIFPQLWHVGLVHKPKVAGVGAVFDSGIGNTENAISPSGIIGGNGLPLEKAGQPATVGEIERVIQAYGNAASAAQRLHFDGVEVHGAHGYLIDQFLWDKTNLRNDEYGGDLARRSRVATEVIREIRRRVGPSFPVVLRLSLWKQQDYTAKLVTTPQEWATIIEPLVEAGVDAFHLSQRRYWEGEFGTELNLAAWTKKLTGKPAITVGSVTLDNSTAEMMQGKGSSPTNNIAPMLASLVRGQFDLVAVGRAMIANPDWPRRIRDRLALNPYTLSMLQTLD